MTPVTLHDGDAGHLSEVMVSMGDAFDKAYGEAWTRAQCLGILGLPGVWLLLARNGDAPAGFALARATIDEAELLLLAVRADFRRNGIGRALLDRVMVECRNRNMARIHLEVRDGNGAINLYRTLGFEQVGRRRAYYRGQDGNFYDALTMSRPIIAR